MQTSFTKVLSLIFSILVAIPLLPAALFQYTGDYFDCKTVQTQRLKAMRNGKINIVDEQSFASFNLSDKTIKYNEVRMLTTHNSYKKALSERIYKLSTLVFGPDKFKSIMYEHDTPVKQLENGVRGLELDLRWQYNGFKIFHSPMPDNLSNSPDWKMTLEELSLWSDANPNHVPITILVEFKNDDPYRNLLFKKMDASKFKELDNTIKTIMGDKVLTAADLMGNYPTLAEMVKNNDWPTLSSLKGKFIFLLHPDAEYTDIYINMDKTLKTQVFIPVFSIENIESHYDYSAFILYNNPDVDVIKDLVSKHYVVRTFIDNGQLYREDYKARALASGAQMLTTDLEKGVIMPKTDYAAYLEGNYTIIKDSKIQP
ncbi:MAG: Ca2+-dependent phosphoinositide-specific phospholipase C [Eubacteriales bacterium]